MCTFCNSNTNLDTLALHRFDSCQFNVCFIFKRVLLDEGSVEEVWALSDLLPINLALSPGPPLALYRPLALAPHPSFDHCIGRACTLSSFLAGGCMGIEATFSDKP